MMIDEAAENYIISTGVRSSDYPMRSWYLNRIRLKVLREGGTIYSGRLTISEELNIDEVYGMAMDSRAPDENNVLTFGEYL